MREAKQRGFKAFESELLPEIGELLADESNVNSVCLVAQLRALFPDKRPKACPSIWNSSPLSHPNNLQTVAEALKNSTSNHPRVHSVWGHLLADLYMPASLSTAAKLSSSYFCQITVIRQRKPADMH